MARPSLCGTEDSWKGLGGGLMGDPQPSWGRCGCCESKGVEEQEMAVCRAQGPVTFGTQGTVYQLRYCGQ